MSEDIPKTQKAVVYASDAGKIEYKEIPVPTPGPNELLIHVKYTGVCHTDIDAWRGDWPLPTEKPLVGGHEGAGVVVGMGRDVQYWNIGDYAGIKWLYSCCMQCEFCEEMAEPNCPHAVLSGYTHNGSFQQYAVADATQAARIPKGVDLAEAAPILCAGVTAYTALKTTGVIAGQWVGISGAGGGLGSVAVQYAKAMGFRVLGIDSGEKKDYVTNDLGVDAFIDFTTEKDVVAAVKNATDGGPHGVINVSTSNTAINQSTEYVRTLGVVVLVGLPAGSKVVASVFDSVVRSIQIRGSYVGNRRDTAEALDFFARGLVKCPIKIGKLRDVEEVFKLMEAGKINGRYVLDTSK
ncbi:uncharacterized protein LODBEIA_P54730 [Lodderomyces beijingensis]|uniref:alcohol dehydrogenase n=1 Tax=Lodderomyces beijingensis TaxID=1775926 RepID=A0ABP0ZSZ1_9ASCO